MPKSESFSKMLKVTFNLSEPSLRTFLDSSSNTRLTARSPPRREMSSSSRSVLKELSTFNPSTLPTLRRNGFNRSDTRLTSSVLLTLTTSPISSVKLFANNGKQLERPLPRNLSSQRNSSSMNSVNLKKSLDLLVPTTSEWLDGSTPLTLPKLPLVVAS